MWIDFANSLPIGRVLGADPFESEDGLLEWLETHSALPQIGDLRHVRELRELLYSVVSSLATDGNVSLADAGRIESLVRDTAFHADLDISLGQFQMTAHSSQLGDGVSTVLHNFAQTISGLEIERIRKCESNTCGIHFYDDSKNGRRRWCSMAVCGNRAKAAAFQSRQRST